MLRNKNLLVILFVIILLTGSGIAVNQVIGSNRTPELESWPPFTMLYTDEGFGIALGGKLGSQTTKLDYNSFTNWKVTITDNDAVPETEGTWGTYDGQTITYYKYSPNFIAALRHVNCSRAHRRLKSQ